MTSRATPTLRRGSCCAPTGCCLERGQLGYVTTNTLIEGATLEVGLEQVPSHYPRGTLTSSVADEEREPADRRVLGQPRHSRPREPSTGWTARKFLQSALTCSRMDGSRAAHSGSARTRTAPSKAPYVSGLGFTLTDEQKDELIAHDPRNAEVIQPYVIGKDLNQRPDCSASRWVINFRDWPLERAEEYPDCIDIVRRLVKPERDRNKTRQRREIWWRLRASARLNCTRQSTDSTTCSRSHASATRSCPFASRQAKSSDQTVRSLRTGRLRQPRNTLVEHSFDLGDPLHLDDARPTSGTRPPTCSSHCRGRSRLRNSKRSAGNSTRLGAT